MGQWNGGGRIADFTEILSGDVIVRSPIRDTFLTYTFLERYFRPNVRHWKSVRLSEENGGTDQVVSRYLYLLYPTVIILYCRIQIPDS